MQHQLSLSYPKHIYYSFSVIPYCASGNPSAGYRFPWEKEKCFNLFHTFNQAAWHKLWAKGFDHISRVLSGEAAMFSIKMRQEDMKYCGLSQSASIEVTPPLNIYRTHTGSFRLRCIFICACLFVRLALCAHDTGIPSSLYHLMPVFPLFTSILFFFGTCKNSSRHRNREEQHSV